MNKNFFNQEAIRLATFEWFRYCNRSNRPFIDPDPARCEVFHDYIILRSTEGNIAKFIRGTGEFIPYEKTSVPALA